MGQCPPESMWVRGLAAELTPAEEAALREHAAGCPACADRWRDMRAVWGVLGEWTVRPPVADLAGPILRAALRERTRARWLRRGRMAAAIALVVGLGVLAGRLTPSGRYQRQVNAVSPEKMVQQIGLDVLGPDTAVLANLLEAAAGDDAIGQETPL